MIIIPETELTGPFFRGGWRGRAQHQHHQKTGETAEPRKLMRLKKQKQSKT